MLIITSFGYFQIAKKELIFLSSFIYIYVLDGGEESEYIFLYYMRNGVVENYIFTNFF